MPILYTWEVFKVQEYLATAHICCVKVLEWTQMKFCCKTSVKKFNQITTHIASQSMSGFIIKNLSNFRWCDMLGEHDPAFRIVLYGGESTSQNNIYILLGSVSPSLSIHCLKFTENPLSITGVTLPLKRNEYSEASSVCYVQNGDFKPGSRFGHCLVKLDENTLSPTRLTWPTKSLCQTCTYWNCHPWLGTNLTLTFLLREAIRQLKN